MPIIVLMGDGLRDYVKNRRRELGLTQKELAVRAGVNQPTISDIERGQVKLPGAEARRGIARAFGVSHIEFLIEAGELSRDEVTASGLSGVVEFNPDDPRNELIGIVKRIDVWPPGTFKAIRVQLEGLLEDQRAARKGKK